MSNFYTHQQALSNPVSWEGLVVVGQIIHQSKNFVVHIMLPPFLLGIIELSTLAIIVPTVLVICTMLNYC